MTSLLKRILPIFCIIAGISLHASASGPLRMPLADALDGVPSLITHGADQFVCFYAPDRSLTVGHRSTNSTRWEFRKLSTIQESATDYSVTIDIDNNGLLHIYGSSMYFRSARPLDIDSLEKVEKMDPSTPTIGKKDFAPGQDRTSDPALKGRYHLQWDTLEKNNPASTTLYLVDTKPYSAMLESFPVGADPLFIGNKVASRLLETRHQLYGDRGIHYAEVCTWYGAVRFAEETGNKELLDRLKLRFDYLLDQEKDLLPPPIHVDQNMFGCLPLRLYGITSEKRYFDLGLTYADTQWTLPENASTEQKAWQDQDYSWQTRLWIDDMFMITIVQKEAYLRTGDKKYLDRAAREMVMYLRELQRENGLFYHAPDVPYCWARGDGWMAVGMADLLELLPEDNVNRAPILEGYLRMMEGLRRNINGDGIWNQVITEKDFWTESSGSAMFTYAMIRGVGNGWLDEGVYAPIVRRAWLALCNYVDPAGDVDEVCVGTGKNNSRQYYYNRPRVKGDYHGQAPVIWCALALLSH